VKTKDKKLKAIRDRSPAAFTEMEQAAILKKMFNNCEVTKNTDVVDLVDDWCTKTRMFSIILEAALKGEVAIGVEKGGILSFGIEKDGTDAAKLIKELAVSDSVVGKEGQKDTETAH
jgi:hypothetical protein